MRISCKIGDIKKLVAEHKLTNEVLLKELRYSSEDKDTKINLTELTPEELDLVEKMLHEAGLDKEVKKLGQFRKLNADPLTATISRLEALELALLEFVGGAPHHWLFANSGDGTFLPYYVSHIAYVPPSDSRRGDPEPAYVTMTLNASRRGSKVDQTLNWKHGDLKGKFTVSQLLMNRGYFIETPALVEAHAKEIERYREVRGLLGEQFAGLGRGYAKVFRRYRGGNGGYESIELVELEIEGEPARLVMDDTVNESDNGDTSVVGEPEDRFASSEVWARWARQKSAGKLGKTEVRKADLDLGEDETQSEVPMHPYVKCFDLSPRRQRFTTVHVNNIEPWKYVENLIDKLVLEDDRKGLLRLLIASSSDLHEDIVKGKTGGTMVVSTGEPGTGKTLTAEVFAEEMRRPLYVVQCSQLGVEPDELEEKLNIVLARGTRWKAILLLDEADVYVHERGSNIVQNAIVGVFLRVLEYYRGILFMTSNRDVIVDDAIMSRATAHIRYDIPRDTTKLLEVWSILTSQYEIRLGEDTIRNLLEIFPPGSISPRNVKNILKLARTKVRHEKAEVTTKLFAYVSQFIDLAHPEAVNKDALNLALKAA